MRARAANSSGGDGRLQLNRRAEGGRHRPKPKSVDASGARQSEGNGGNGGNGGGGSGGGGGGVPAAIAINRSNISRKA